MNYEDLSPELQEKARVCTSVKELAELAEAEGIALSDEELESLSGGVDWAAGCEHRPGSNTRPEDFTGR